MATSNKNTGLKGTISENMLLPKKDLKKTDKNIEDTEKAVSKIHSSQGKQKRITLDIPQHLHTEIKIKTFRQGITLREYFLNLAEADLNL